jgi:hypothetical protein
VNFKASLQQGSIPRASALDREAALEYWTQFPLKTAADVQAWHKGRYESYSSLPLHADTLDDMDMDQNDDTTNSNQLSSSNDNSNAHRYDNNIHRGAARKEGAHPPSPETRKSRDKTAPTVQDVWGTFLHTSDGQYPPSSSRGTTTSRDTTLSPLPVGPAGIEPQGIPSARDSSIGYAGLGFSQEFQERFLW